MVPNIRMPSLRPSNLITVLPRPHYAHAHNRYRNIRNSNSLRANNSPTLLPYLFLSLALILPFYPAYSSSRHAQKNQVNERGKDRRVVFQR